jgi:molybdopterin converting factor small subunit
MSVQVAYMSQVKSALNLAAEEIDLPTPCTVHDLLAQLVRRHGQPLARLLCDADGRLQPTVLICLGDRQVRLGDPTPVTDGDQVTLLAPMSGG